MTSLTRGAAARSYGRLQLRNLALPLAVHAIYDAVVLAVAW